MDVPVLVLQERVVEVIGCERAAQLFGGALHLRMEREPLRYREPGDLFLMSVEHDHQFAQEVLVVVEPHLPERSLIQYRCERRATQRAAGSHALLSNRSTMSSPPGGGASGLRARTTACSCRRTFPARSDRSAAATGSEYRSRCRGSQRLADRRRAGADPRRGVFGVEQGAAPVKQHSAKCTRHHSSQSVSASSSRVVTSSRGGIAWPSGLNSCSSVIVIARRAKLNPPDSDPTDQPYASRNARSNDLLPPKVPKNKAGKS